MQKIRILHTGRRIYPTKEKSNFYPEKKSVLLNTVTVLLTLAPCRSCDSCARARGESFKKV
jgi:hypothetical protein